MIRLRLALCLILLLGAALRLPELTRTGLWLDEGVSVRKAASPISAILSGNPADPSPPLYYLLLKGWLVLLGPGEASLRLPSLLSGLIAIFLAWLIGRRLFDEGAGLLGAALVAVSPLQVYFSTEARMYELQFALSLASMYFFVELLAGKPGRFLPAAYLFSSGAVVYLHNFGFAVLLVQNLYVALSLIFPGGGHKLPGKRWLILQAVLLLIYLPWLLVIFGQFTALKGGYWTPPLRFFDVFVTLKLLAGSRLLIPALLVLALLGLKRRWGLLLLLWVILPVLIPALISIVLMPIYVTRITVFSQAGLILLAVSGFSRLPFRVRMPMAIGLFFLAASALSGYFRTPIRQPLREVAAWLKTREGSGQVLIHPSWYQNTLGGYYRLGPDGRGKGINAPRPVDASASAASHYLVNCEELPEPCVFQKLGWKPVASFPYLNFQSDRWMQLIIYQADPSGRRDEPAAK